MKIKSYFFTKHNIFTFQAECILMQLTKIKFFKNCLKYFALKIRKNTHTNKNDFKGIYSGVELN